MTPVPFETQHVTSLLLFHTLSSSQISSCKTATQVACLDFIAATFSQTCTTAFMNQETSRDISL